MRSVHFIKLSIIATMVTMTSFAQKGKESLSLFKQEKAYLHTDKPYYLVGDTIWLKGYLVDADTHRQQNTESRFLYVELINRKNQVIIYRKIKSDEYSYSNYIPIHEGWEVGEYQLRCYTLSMVNGKHEYFPTKTITIYPRTSSMVNVSIRYINANKEAIIHFTQKGGIPYANSLVEYMIRTKKDGNKFQRQRTNDNGYVQIEIPPREQVEQYIYTLLHDEELKHPFYFYIPPVYDYTIGFYPEGGYSIARMNQKIAFKAETTTGEIAKINGYVLNSRNDTLTAFRSEHDGMGTFFLNVDEKDSLKVVTNDNRNIKKTFKLPCASSERISLAISQTDGQLYCNVLHSDMHNIQDSLFLLAHTRGKIVGTWLFEESSNSKIISTSLFPEGVACFTVFNKDSIPLCERLVFIKQPEAVFQLATSGKATNIRSKINMGLRILDEKGTMLQGDFSMSVTDDFAVNIDTLGQNIRSELLLSSDLKGNIVNPGYYFQKETKELSKHLDLVMLTHGWRRFCAEDVLEKTQLRQSVAHSETSMILSGSVTKQFKRPATGERVLISHVEGTYKKIVMTDSLGRFQVILPEISTSHKIQTTFEVSLLVNNNAWKYSIHLDDHYSLPSPHFLHTFINQPSMGANYLNEVQGGYTIINGERVYQLPEVSVLSSFTARGWHSFKTIEQERIEQSKARDVKDILATIPGVFIDVDYNTGKSQIRMISKGRPTANFVLKGTPSSHTSIASRELKPETRPVNVFVNGKRMKNVDDILYLNSDQIKMVDLIKRSKAEAIHLTTIHPNEPLPSVQPHIARTKLYAYNKNAQFYSPKYPTEASRKIVNSDKRTTLHWEPNLRLNERGEAGLSFYTADRPSTYTIVIEGVTTDGKVCRYMKRIK